LSTISRRRLSRHSRIRSRSQASEKKTAKSHFLVVAVTAFFVALLTKACDSSLIPFEMFEFWGVRGSAGDWFDASWPIFVWGAVAALVLLPVLHAVAPWLFRPMEDIERSASARLRSAGPGEILAKGFVVSVLAGVLEEVSFRWLIFLGAFGGLYVTNWVFGASLGFILLGLLLGAGLGKLVSDDAIIVGLLIGGVAGLALTLAGVGTAVGGLPEAIHLHIAGPVANWATLGGLEEYLFHPSGWLVGAAMLSANTKFRDGHKYQGLLGYLNSWFLGMFFFWLMLTFGLPVAILMHFAYDLLLFVLMAGMKAITG
jgi:hypothetical protein